jgi:co-chaperonin GroES (HSP10)
MSYRVIFDKILVKRDPKTENPNALLIPDEVKKEPSSGEILAVGNEVKYVSGGERIYFSPYAGFFLETTQDLQESDLIVMREDEILAIEDVEIETT